MIMLKASTQILFYALELGDSLTIIQQHYQKQSEHRFN